MNPKNDPPAVDVSNLATTPANRTLAEDAVDGLAFRQIVISDLDLLQAPAGTQVQVAVDVLHGGLEFGPVPGITFITAQEVPAGLDGLEPLHGGTYQKRVLQGTIADLNAALGTLKYYGDVDFNSTAAGERLVIEVNDLGQIGTSDPALTALATVTLTVLPVNDPPEFTVAPAIWNCTSTRMLLPRPSTIGPRRFVRARRRADEAPQNVSFRIALVTKTGNLAFAANPTLQLDPVTHTADLAYAVLPDTNGYAIFEVTLRDDGGTPANTADDVDSIPQRLTIIVGAAECAADGGERFHQHPRGHAR